METGIQVYGAGSASLFAGLARGGAVSKRCDVCGKVSSGGETVNVYGYEIPESHTACKGQVERNLCTCYELIGDNEMCVVHGKGQDG